MNRPIVSFRLSDQPGEWPVVVGRPEASAEDVIAALQRRYGDRLLETLEWTPA